MSAAIDPRLGHVGSQIRSHRQRTGLSLSALAARAGIGKGTLSELEQGLRNPTLETLYAVAGVLAVPLAGFVSGGDPDQRGTVAVGGGNVSANLLEARRLDDGSLVEVYWLAIAPGERHSPGHGPAVAERLVMVRGSATVGPVGRALLVHAGETAAWESSGAHIYASETGAEAVLTILNPPAPPG